MITRRAWRTLVTSAVATAAVAAELIYLPTGQAHAYPLATWSGPFGVSTPGIMAADPKLAMSSDGTRATAIWRNYNGSNTVRTASAVLTGSSAAWGSITDLTPPDFNGIGGSDVAVSADGTRAVAVWSGTSGGAYVTRAASAVISGNSATWGTPWTLSSPGPDAVGPKITLSATGGQATAAWASGGSRQFGLVTASGSISGTSSSWSAPVELVAAHPGPFGFDIGASADGSRATVVWQRDSGSGAVLESASATINATTPAWGTAVTISPLLNDPFITRLEVSSDGSHVNSLWTSWNGARTSVMAAAATVAGATATWGVAQTIASPQNSTAASFAASADGSVITAEWLEWLGAGYVARSRTATVSATSQNWGSPTNLTTSGDTGVSPGTVGISADGSRVVASWTHNSSANNVGMTIIGTVSGNTVNWGATSTVANGDPLLEFVTVLSRTGTLAAALFVPSNGGSLQSTVAAITNPPPNVQLPIGGCVTPPRRIRRGWVIRLAKQLCATTAGQTVGIAAVAEIHRDSNRRRRKAPVVLMCHFGLRARDNKSPRQTGWGDGSVYCPYPSGPLLARISNTKMRLIITWYAPPTATFAAYRFTRRYWM